MLLVRHYIDRSPIHGLGVFAHENIAAGTQIWAFHPAIDIVIGIDQLATLPGHVVERVQRCAEYYPDRQVFILGADGDSFMNHSDWPNLRNDGTTGYATRDIAIGDEITCDYRLTRVLDFDLKVKSDLVRPREPVAL
jgi:uncharacterized protein